MFPDVSSCVGSTPARSDRVGRSGAWNPSPATDSAQTGSVHTVKTCSHSGLPEDPSHGRADSPKCAVRRGKSCVTGDTGDSQAHHTSRLQDGSPRGLTELVSGLSRDSTVRVRVLGARTNMKQ
ncbi:hypothetical protein Q5P01_012945 [Channa striata]|uniref:Uncharacterized protein n=1 Tax=Channa striata TaxID=64152 RepID=A0AA88MQP5_CHASR|nr:hypothetical protein Q5P01_012945 [Channa striata]